MSTPTTAQKSSGIKKSPAYMINSLITVAIMLIFGMLPPFAPITQLGMQVAGIFIGLIYGWTTVGLIWPSMLGMILLSLTSYGSINQVLIEGFGSSTVVMILFILIFAAAVTASGEHLGLHHHLLGHPLRHLFVPRLQKRRPLSCLDDLRRHHLRHHRYGSVSL